MFFSANATVWRLLSRISGLVNVNSGSISVGNDASDINTGNVFNIGEFCPIYNLFRNFESNANVRQLSQVVLN